MGNKQFYYTQTSVKDLEKEETCPTRWKAQWLDGLIPFRTNEDLDKGNYFEQIVLGSGATGNKTIDLPRLKTGEKSADHQRIDSQAERAKRILFDGKDPEWLGFHLVSTQEELKIENRKGTIDIRVVDEQLQEWILDLKLTKDLSSDRTKYGWGNNWEEMDLLQQTHYEDLYEKKYGSRPKMGLLVFDYSPKKRAEFGEINISDNKRLEKEARFKAAEEVVNVYNERGWTKLPSETECGNCPLTCDRRKENSKIVRKIVNY